jgi:hypothetical protein
MVMAGRGSSTDMVITNKNGSDVFTIPTGTTIANFVGSVGIGTASPAHLLTVFTSSASTATAGGIVRIGNFDYSGQTNNQVLSLAPGIFGMDAPGVANGRFIINATGSVGIGTASPVSLLDVTGANPVLTLNRTSGAFTNTINFNTTGTNYASIISNAGSGEQRYSIGLSAGFGGFHTFYTDTAERMRITSGGALLVATTTSAGIATGSSANPGIDISEGSIASQRNNFANQYWSKATGYTSGDFTAHYVNGSYVGGISTNGTTTIYAVASDYRLKEDFQEINGIKKVQAIKVYDYKWKESEDRMDGVIAHELQEVLPYAVVGDKDSERMQSVDYSKIVPVLIKAIQELKAEIDSLKTKSNESNA